MHFNSAYAHKATRRWKTFDCWCCPPQLFRTIAGMGRWVYGKNADTLYVNLFTSCDYKDDEIEICMRTEYPWDASVQINVVHAENKKLKIRIPSWCENPKVNGEKVEHGYYEINVKSGDEIQVEFPMKAVFMQANPNVEADRGMICVKRGPVVYCAEGIDCDTELDNICLEVRGTIQEHYEKDFLNGVVVLDVPAKKVVQKNDLYYKVALDGEDTILKMIPYYA